MDERDAAWLFDMAEAAEIALRHAEGLDREMFFRDQLRQDAVIRQLIVLGEAAKRVSPSLQAAHPEIPWQSIAGFRDVLVHQYRWINLGRVWEILRGGPPRVLNLIRPLIPPIEES